MAVENGDIGMLKSLGIRVQMLIISVKSIFLHYCHRRIQSLEMSSFSLRNLSTQDFLTKIYVIFVINKAVLN